MVAAVMAIVSVIVTCGSWASVFATPRPEIPLVAGLALVGGAAPAATTLPEEDLPPAGSHPGSTAASSFDEEEDDDVFLDVGDPPEHAPDAVVVKSHEAPRVAHVSHGQWVHLDPSPRPPRV